MAISAGNAINDIAWALANNSSRFILDKATIASQLAGTMSSLWRATGQPAQGAIPGTTPAVPTSATLGSIGFANQTSPVLSYLAWLTVNCANVGTTVEVHDRIAHMGGLVLNVTTSQTVTGMDLSTLSIPADRLGAADYSDCFWWLETYTAGGATASNATINVTFGDNSTADLNLLAVGGTLQASRLLPLTALIPPAHQGKYIRRVNSVILSASTGTAGNFGFTVTRNRTAMSNNVANKAEVLKWDQLGLPEVPNDSCLMLTTFNATTSTGIVRGNGKIIHV
jgi:hypothetical protein